MSLSAEEKKRILRERRQAKMAQGKASERLNDILTQGSSVKSANMVSVLDKPQASGSTTSADVFSKATGINEDLSPTPLHGDPEVPDLSELLHQNEVPEDQDMDAVFQKIFASANVKSENPQNPQDASAKFFTDLMKAMSDELGGNAQGFAAPQAPEETSYQQKLALYQVYQQSLWKARFLFIRFVLHTLNFFYHYRLFESFQSSPYSFIRTVQPMDPARLFFTYFVSCEIAVITGYFTIMSKNGLLKAFSQNHAILKVISLASGFYPPARKLQPLVDNALVYWSGLSIFIGDLMLIVMYFGIISVISR